MSFDLPQERTGTASRLRDMERNAPRDMRATLIQAAQELEAWKALATDLAKQMDEVVGIRLSVMASTSMVEGVQRGIKSTLSEAARRLREMP